MVFIQDHFWSSDKIKTIYKVFSIGRYIGSLIIKKKLIIRYILKNNSMLLHFYFFSDPKAILTPTFHNIDEIRIPIGFPTILVGLYEYFIPIEF